VELDLTFGERLSRRSYDRVATPLGRAAAQSLIVSPRLVIPYSRTRKKSNPHPFTSYPLDVANQ